ncbi:virulence sensor protein [Bordetella ansorpii]|uniref:Virulence sensor protein BvgS n=1 Tax=Bordetella ansorpii TaxID=288768 RepID=A0A157SBZ6_9BORD|nr:ATP-binding protein [Bordetella ansorpii]SAI67436.1 virulence sensor protein [Bordetella ansorpii]
MSNEVRRLRVRPRRPAPFAAASRPKTRRPDRKAGRRAAARSGKTRAAQPGALTLVAHELRTPLSGLIAMLDTLQRTSSGAQQHRLIELGQMAADHLLRLLDGILDSALPASAAPQAFDLHALCRDTHDFWRESARRKGLRLDLGLDGSVPAYVLGNPLRLRQILFNLLANALKFTHRGSVSLRARRQHASSTVRFTVEDSGVGIAADEQARLFRPFRRTRAARLSGYDGAGLGLAISQELVRAMGGRIALRSRIGLGTRVTVDLPLPVADGPTPPASAGPVRPMDAGMRTVQAPAARHTDQACAPAGDRHGERHGRRILLAEDNPIARELIGLQLSQLGHAHDTAADGLEALCRLRAGQYGLLLTDVRMTGMSGAALARHIRRAGFRNVNGEPLPLIAFSAGRPSSNAALDRRFDQWLTKPVSQAELAACLERWLPQDA